jgi:hypothetical protein
MLTFHNHYEGQEAYIKNENTGSYEIVDADEERLIVVLSNAISDSCLADCIKKSLVQAVLRTIFLYD